MEYFSESPHNENDLCKPISIYGKSKLLSTKHLMNLYEKKKFPCLIFRLYQIYGPYQDLNRLIPIVINSCTKDRSFNCSSGIQNRDFLFVDDLVEIILKALKSDISGQIFNIGTGKKRNVKNIILKIKKKLKKGKPLFGKIKFRNEEKIDIFPNIDKMKKFFRWKPKTSFENGLNKTIKYYKRNK